MTDKITYAQLFALLRDPETTDEELALYLDLVPGTGGLDFEVQVNPDTVIMTDGDRELESAMQIGNGIARLRRKVIFYNRIQKFSDRPVLVAEGDSWFQFPLLIRETIDHLMESYNIWSMGAAGDTLQNMLHGKPAKGGFEFMQGLRRQKIRVQAFLFSGAGNDFLGEDPATGLPMLTDLLRPFNGDPTDITGHINLTELERRLTEVQAAYLQVVAMVHGEPGLEQLPILFQGYDFAYPYPHGPNDPRDPSYADNDKWLGRALKAKGILDDGLRRGIIIHLVDRLYQMLNTVVSAPGVSNVWVVDCRGALPRLTDWNDEIHGTTKGFAEVARRFDATLKQALAQPLIN